MAEKNKKVLQYKNQLFYHTQEKKNYGAQKLTVNLIEHTWECCKGAEYFFQHLTTTNLGKKVAGAAGLLVGGKRMKKKRI